MRLVRPTDLADSMLVSTTAVNADANYNAATAYAVDAKCTYGRRIYQSLQDANTGHTPGASVDWWVDAGPSNIWACFDQQTSTASTGTDTLEFTVATGIIDTVALVGVSATVVQLVVRDGLGGAVLYDKTLAFSGDIPTDWYQYFFFDPLTVNTQGVFDGIPPYTSSHATVIVTSGGSLSVSAVLFGLSHYLGDAQYGASAGILDYSKKETDAFGITSFVERAYSKRMSVQLMLPNTEQNRVQRLLYGVRAKPCFWIGSVNPMFSEALTVYGFYKDFSCVVNYSTHSLYSLEIEGLA